MWTCENFEERGKIDHLISAFCLLAEKIKEKRQDRYKFVSLFCFYDIAFRAFVWVLGKSGEEKKKRKGRKVLTSFCSQRDCCPLLLQLRKCWRK